MGKKKKKKKKENVNSYVTWYCNNVHHCRRHRLNIQMRKLSSDLLMLKLDDQIPGMTT